MPANTPSRGYPYSLPADPADVPAALQALAEAIDDDVCDLVALAQAGRAVARVRGTTSFGSQSPSGIGGNTINRVPWDTIDFDTGVGVQLGSQESGSRQVFVDQPGFYFAVATLQVPTLTVPVTSVDYTGLQIRRGSFSVPGTLATRLSGTGNHIPVNNDDRNVKILSLSAGAFMDGTDHAYSIEFRAITTPTIAEYMVRERTLTILRMTDS